MSKIQRVKLGDDWLCECGEKHATRGAWVAAHWDEELIHGCSKCHRKHTMQGGIIRLLTSRTVSRDT